MKRLGQEPRCASYLVFLLLASGCQQLFSYSPGDDPPGDDPPMRAVAGSRIVPVFVEAEGIRTFLHWHDTELNSSCNFRQTTDHGLRCVPFGRSGSTQTTGMVGYVDSECTQPAFPTPFLPDDDGCLADYTVLTTESTSDCIPLDDLPRGNRIEGVFMALGPPGEGGLHSALWGDCSSAADPVAYLPLKQIALSNLATAQIERNTPPGADLEQWWIRSDDGAYARVAFFDPKHAERCRFALESADAPPRCLLSITVSRLANYLDSTCKHAVHTPSSFVCDSPTPRIGSYSACPVPTFRLYSPGAKTTAASTDSGTCEPDEQRQYFLRGEPLDLELVAVDRSERGDGRLRSIEAMTASGSHQLMLRDSLHDVPCAFTRADDGKLRCLPSAYGTRLFVDNACSDPVVELRCDESPSAGMLVRLFGGKRQNCELTYDVHAIGTAVHGPLYTLDGQEICRPTQATGPVHALREKVDPDQFIVGEIKPRFDREL